MKYKLTDLQLEGPDEIKTPQGGYAYPEDSEAYPFAYNRAGQLWLGFAGYYHPYDAKRRLGRMWVNSKLISFYDYPTSKSELFRILNGVKELFKTQENKTISWSHPKWRIEVFSDEINDTILIPLERFGGSKTYALTAAEIGALTPMQRTQYIKSLRKTADRDKVYRKPITPGTGSDKIVPGWGSTNAERRWNRFRLRGDGVVRTGQLLERCDFIDDFDKAVSLDFEEGGAFPIGMGRTTGEIWIGRERGTHSSRNIKGNMLRNDEYRGRIWVIDKYLSFWHYPESASAMRRFLKKLVVAFKEERGIKLNFNDPEWRIEEDPGYEDTGNVIDLKDWLRKN